MKDIKIYLNIKNTCKTNQKVIELRNTFKEYLIKIQIGNNMKNWSNYEFNKIIVKEYAQYYYEYQIDQYKGLQDSET